MKVLVNIARGLVGGLFIFSGLVKAIDPKGLSYKMQEFFEVWVRDGFLPKLMNTFNEHSLTFSIVIITLEVILGLALLVGWQKKNDYLVVTFANPIFYFFNSLCFVYRQNKSLWLLWRLYTTNTHSNIYKGYYFIGFGGTTINGS